MDEEERKKQQSIADPRRDLALTRTEVGISCQDIKFQAAHFIAYPGFRETLHGHNYTVSVRVGGALRRGGTGSGSMQPGSPYLLDFGVLKKAAREICDML